MRGELQVQEREDLLKWGRVPSEAVFCRAETPATVAILNARLAARVLFEERRPQGQGSADRMVRHGAHDHLVFVTEGPEALIYGKAISARVWGLYISCGRGRSG